MADRPDEHTTRLLNRLAAGDGAAADEVLPLVYGELRRLAEIALAPHGPAHSLQPTALVSEAWLRLGGDAEQSFESRGRFYALASTVMRSVLVDHARRRGAERRGGGRPPQALTLDCASTDEPDLDVLALHEALGRLGEMDPELERLVELRFFGGLSHPEIAELTSTSLRTVERRWKLARAWLHAELAG